MTHLDTRALVATMNLDIARMQAEDERYRREHRDVSKLRDSLLSAPPLRVADGKPYVRLMPRHPGDCEPWQVRRNRPDQTFEILSRWGTRHAAEAIARTPHGLADETKP